MGLAGVCALRRSAGYILVGGAGGQSAAAAARRCSEGGWASGGVRSFSRAAAAMAPIKVRLLADPTGAFGKETDLLLDDSLVSIFGNRRLKRFSMVVQDGIVKALNVEPDGTGLTCSLAPNIISQL
ncbi:PRDX5 isoform 2 [Pan troglodytes]|uniref:Peroxiredoxin 5 n=3 Tax=Pan TaxID=9596 RepID=K7AK80_PANTR|nr:peroxiredoxin-5, mitochondrial isoform X4 [Pan troglodytes]XP_024786411.1 peroxiredoxin-5, mitochondrial isoform X3 [Pan paniscus]PNI94064.1 PRDX5 isoform 2 [Pan troglodytes]